VARRRRQPRPVPLHEREIAEGEALDVYRIVKTTDRRDPAFVDGFRSRAELGIPPRQYSPEAMTPRIHEGLSAFTTFERAAETARKFPPLGGYIARVRLVAGCGFTIGEWGTRGPEGHLTIFGDALMLSQAVVDIVLVNEGST